MCIPFSLNNKVANTSATADVHLTTLLMKVMRVAALIIPTQVRHIHILLPFYFIEDLVDQDMAHWFFTFVINALVARLIGIYASASRNSAGEVIVCELTSGSVLKKVLNELLFLHFIIIIYFSFMRHTLYRETLLSRIFVPPLIGNF